MRMKKEFKEVRKVILAVLAVLALGCASYFLENQKEKPLRDQIRNLQVQLANARMELKHDTIRDSIPVVSQQVITISKSDYKKEIADRELIKDLNLQLKQIREENRMLLATVGTVPLKPAENDSDSIFVYHDAWTDFEVNMKTRNLQYEVRDSLVTFVTAIHKHKFLWWKWGVKGYNVKHVNFNPRSQIRYSQSVIVE